MSKKANRRGKRGPVPSQTVAQPSHTQPIAPNTQRASLLPFVRPSGTRSDNFPDPLLQSLIGLIGAPIILTTKTAVRYKGIVASTAAQGNTTGVTLSDVKDLTVPGSPLKPSLFIASTNIEGYTSASAGVNPVDSDPPKGNADVKQKNSVAAPERKPQAHGSFDGIVNTFPPPASATSTITPTRISNGLPKVSVKGAGNPAFVQDQSPLEKAPSPSSNPIVNPGKKIHVAKEKEQLAQKRQEDFASRKKGLIEFNQSFKLNFPTPNDLVPILTKDKEKQRLIKAGSMKDAKSNHARAVYMSNLYKAKESLTPGPRAVKTLMYIQPIPPFKGRPILSVPSVATSADKIEKSEPNPDPAEAVYNPFFGVAPLKEDQSLRINDDFKANEIPKLAQIDPHWPYQGAVTTTPTSSPQVLPTAASGFCRFLLLQILNDRDQRVRIRDLSGDDAQVMVDYLDIVSHEADTLEADEQRRVLSLFCKIAKSAKLFPQCYALSGIEYTQEAIAGGSFADVWKGKRGDKTLCLKVVRVYRKQENDGILRTHVQELALWAHLSHKNILPFYGVYLLGTTTPRMCLVSPWMERGNLRDYLDEFRQKPRLPFISDIVNGLAYLHGLQIVHSDLKAQNVLVSGDERALITDFGLSSVAATTTLTSTGGTTRFMAPELVTGEGKVTEPCDIWSFACLCYEVLTNKLPFYQYKNTQIFSVMIKKEIPRRPEALDGEDDESSKELDEKVWKLLVKCWDYEPHDRPNCEAIQEALEDIGFQDDRPEAVTDIETGSSFWRAMREESGDNVNYWRVVDILLPIYSSRLFTQTQGEDD